MTATSYGLLAKLSTILMAMMIFKIATMTLAMTISTERLSPLSSAEASTKFFDLSTRMDEDELMQEYGRYILSNMNQSISPCEDFYEYACGNWKHAETVPEKSRNDTFLRTIQTKLDDMLNAFLKNTTEDELKKDTAEAKAKLFFKTCMAMNKDMPKGYKLLLESEEFLAKLEPKKDSNSTFDWINVNFMSHYGMYPLLPLKVQYDTVSRRFHILLNAPHKVLGRPDVVAVKNLTRDLGIEDEEKQKEFSDELTELITFEKNLTSYATKRNATQTLSLGEFLRVHKDDRLNWTRYFEVAFNGTAKSEWVVENTLNDTDTLVKFLSKTDLQTLRNYLKWRTLMKFYYIWKSEFREKSTEGICREHTEQYFNYALIPWFIDNVYDADRRADILEIVRPIKETFYGLIDRYTWLDDETKSNAKTKLTSMDVQVGYTDDMRHRELIDQIYTSMDLSRDWFKNLQVVEANRAHVRMRSVNKAIIPPLMSTRNVNAYYADFLNLAFIAIGISQMPFYHIKFPPSLKFGGIGHIIGHEMAHGFDSYCYQYNYDGKKENWWTEASLRNFRERYRCLESQYNKYIFHGVPTDGNQTSTDNIADNVGTRIAYHAYLQNYGKRDGDVKPIAGLKFTNKQLFFLKFAQTWCTGKDDAYKMNRIKNDVHAYEEFRVVGTLSNMPEFSEVFSCKLGADMNPLKKCVVW